MLLEEIEQQTKRDEKLKDIVATLTSPRSWRITGSNKVLANNERNNARIIQDTPTRDEGPEVLFLSNLLFYKHLQLLIAGDSEYGY